MTVEISIEHHNTSCELPSNTQFIQWVQAALPDDKLYQLSIITVDEAEMTTYNKQYRNKTGSTNVLSFPAQIPETIQSPLLGDIIICPDVVTREAEQQHKQPIHHWAHLTIHGTLHLLGYDHQQPAEADAMETLEIKIMETLGFPNPYIEVAHHD